MLDGLLPLSLLSWVFAALMLASTSRLQVITADSMVRDIHLMKQHNFNTVRCAHYPNSYRW